MERHPPTSGSTGTSVAPEQPLCAREWLGDRGSLGQADCQVWYCEGGVGQPVLPRRSLGVSKPRETPGGQTPGTAHVRKPQSTSLSNGSVQSHHRTPGAEPRSAIHRTPKALKPDTAAKSHQAPLFLGSLSPFPSSLLLEQPGSPSMWREMWVMFLCIASAPTWTGREMFLFLMKQSSNFLYH